MKEPNHSVWTRREIMLYTYIRSMTPLASYCPDNELLDGIRLMSVYSAPVQVPTEEQYNSYMNNPAIKKSYIFLPSEKYNKSVRLLFNQTNSFSNWIHIDTPGFLPNQRSFTMFGIAALQVASCIKY